jgi:aspartyl-tRNA(Asn)/glutamyl-tRNA(Gln) amidotransferase subunit B
LSTRCEIKNVNSIRFIGQAIEAEARRQIDILEDGGTIEQETRLFDPRKLETRSMRTKEEAHDYRYFPDPDLLPLELDAAWIEEIKASLPELPDEKKARFVADFGLSPYDAQRAGGRARGGRLLRGGGARPRRQGGGQLGGQRTVRAAQPRGQGDRGHAGQSRPARRHPRSAGRRHDLGQDRQGAVRHRVERGRRSAHLVESRGLTQVTDVGAIEQAVDTIIAANPDKVEQVKAKPAMLGWFVGQVMKASQGKANPQAANEILRRKLGI